MTKVPHFSSRERERERERKLVQENCRMNKCFLIMLPTSGKFGLNVITNGNNFSFFFPRVLSKSFLEWRRLWRIDPKLI